MWKAEDFGWASVAYADGHLYLHGTNGDFVLAEATPKAIAKRGDSLRLLSRSINRPGSMRRWRLYIL